MAIEVKLPDLGVESGDVEEILVKVGETVEADQGLVEVKADKASAQIPAPSAGKITKIHIEEGATINVGDVLISMEASEASAAPASPATSEEPALEQKQTVVESPAPVETPAPVPEPVAPEKVQAEAPAPIPATPPVTPVAPPVTSTPAANTPAFATSTTTGNLKNVPAGPAMRRFAREVGVDLRTVSGTGEGGRIQREDILAVVRSGNRTMTSEVSTQTSDGPKDSDGFGPVRYEKISRIRKTIANQMHKSWSECPRVTNFDDADVTDLEEFRQASKADYAAQGLKLTSMPFIIKSFALALRNNPTINASIDMEKGQIVYKEYVNIGIAVDSKDGLMVPVLRNADRLSIPDIARALDELVSKVRDGNISIDDMRGGTFSISNLGAIGGQYSTPIINIPESAIILIGRSRKMPVIVGDDIVPRLMMPLSISYDHRLIDGATAARFLNDAIGFLSAPSRILMAP